MESASGTDARQLLAAGFLSGRVIRGLLGVTGGSNHFDFHIGAPRQRGDLNGRTGRGILFEIRAVCFVYGLKVAEVGEEDRGFNDAVESHSLSSQDGCDVVQDSPGLRGNIARNDLARLRIERNLAAAKKEPSATHGLRIGADCRWRVVRGNDLLHVADCNLKSGWHNEWQRLRSFRLKFPIYRSYNDPQWATGGA